MKGYVKQALLELKHLCPKQHHYGPSKLDCPDYGQKIQYVKLYKSDSMTATDILHKQQVSRKFLFYVRIIDKIMLHSLNDISSSVNTKECAEAIKYFLNYAAPNPKAKIIYRASNMILQLDSNAASLVCPKAQSRNRDSFFLGNKDRKLFNGALMVLAKIIKNVMASSYTWMPMKLYQCGKPSLKWDTFYRLHQWKLTTVLQPVYLTTWSNRKDQRLLICSYIDLATALNKVCLTSTRNQDLTT